MASFAGPDVPSTRELHALAAAAGNCVGCDLAGPATQTVFGRGASDAPLMLVGEQPGDREDIEGEPFVGPAGKLLDAALERAGLDAMPRWTTNAVKHFRFVERGKRRLHQTPTAAESSACRPWLAAELEAVRPQVLVALGATAAKSLFGPSFRLTQHRGERVPWPPPSGAFAASDVVLAATVTIHPSAVLRTPDEERTEAFEALVADLRVVHELLAAQ